MENQDLDLIGQTVGNMPYKIGIVDKDGNLKNQFVAKGSTNRIDIPQSILGTDGGSTGEIDSNHPSAGADYYAGSLANGEITQRYLLYQRDESVAEKTGSQTVTLLRDVGLMFNMAVDGATFLIHLQRTAMTKGAKGNVTDIELNYDTKNVAKKGYFTTTSPYPLYIKAAALATKKTLSIPINGIGENLSDKNVKAPQLNVTFNGDGTMTYYSVTGYDNDGNTAGATGANYDVVVDVIATFSTQPAVAQLPTTVNLFSGLATGEIALAGIDDFFSNVCDGIEVTLEDNLYETNDNHTEFYTKVPVSQFVESPVFRISKEQIINGYDVPIPLKTTTDIAVNTSSKHIAYYTNHMIGAPKDAPASSWYETSNYYYNFNGFSNPTLTIGLGNITNNIMVKVGSLGDKNSFVWNVLKVVPYKD